MQGKAEDLEGICTTVTAKEGNAELVPQLPADLVILGDLGLLTSIIDKVKPTGFLLAHSPAEAPLLGSLQDFAVISQKSSANHTMVFHRKMDQVTQSSRYPSFHIPLQEDSDFSWVSKLQGILRNGDSKSSSRIYLTSQNVYCLLLDVF